MTPEDYRPKLKHSAVLSLLMMASLIANTSCNRTANKTANGNGPNSNSSAVSDETTSAPPFPTKEPERYQATMVTSTSAGPEATNIPGLSSLTNLQMPVARDGEKRRVETEISPGVKIIYLQLASGRYALNPTKKIYAEIKLDGSNNPMNSATGVPSDFSPDKLISSATTGASYEKLGTEQINGRTTTKYRVTTGGGEDPKTKSETIIWADESLGMPIKSETTTKDGGKFTWELRDIKLEVDAALFELPKDYRKVDNSELFSSTLRGIKDILGIGGENKSGKKR